MTFRYTTSGESHGPELTAIVEGVPAGLPLKAVHLDRDLARRQLGHGRGGRMQIEADRAQITSGVRHGHTLASPIAIKIKNRDWRNWTKKMSAAEVAAASRGEAVSIPRPGHADLAGVQKYGFSDIRNVLERASARETAARVAVGGVARRLLDEFGVELFSHVVRIGPVKARRGSRLSASSLAAVDTDPVRCLDAMASAAMVKAINTARQDGESLGGVFEVVVFGLESGLGSYISGPERLGGRLAGALMSIPAIKGVEIGDGFALGSRPGSRSHDEIFFDARKGYFRKTNHAGGLEGGMTTGETLVVRACMKPIPTLTRPLRSVDTQNGKPVPAHKERSDICAVPAAAVVGEAMVAIVLAGAMLSKFGGDCLEDMKESFLVYKRRLRRSWPPASSS